LRYKKTTITRPLYLILIWFILFWNSCGQGSNDGHIKTASFADINGDGYADLAVGSHGGYSGSEDYVYIFYGNPHGVSTEAASKLRYDNHNAFIMGDVNRDGYADLVVSVNTYDDIGRIYLHFGSGNGLDNNYHSFLDGEIDHSNFGDTLSLNDINKDGYLDLVVGAGNFGNGRVYIYLGTEEGIDAAAWKVITRDTDGAQFGKTLSIGDINGDGYRDLAIGAALSKKVFIYNGTADGFADTPSSTIITSEILYPNPPYFLDLRVLLVDMNKDGYDDLLICNRQKFVMPCPFPVPIDDCGDIYLYRIQLFHGSAGGLDDSLALEFQNSSLTGAMGVGDINADGFTDLVLGCINKVHIHLGSDSGTSETPSQTLNGVDQFGGTLWLEDLNDDGISDLSVGATGLDMGQYIGSRGAVSLYLGGVNGLADLPSMTLEGENTGDRFGSVLPLH
jgi:hypothetical protein